MQLVEFFRRAISDSATGFFIIDSGNYAKDNDFISYGWRRSRNNKIKAGDVFIYRKPQKLSKNGKFNFYGAGQFLSVEGDDDVTATITNPHPFIEPIFQSDLETFKWEWKQRSKGWEHFWGQYGINQITKNDFISLLSLLNESYDSVEDEETVKYDTQIANGNFFVEDELAEVKVRSWQRAWSERVKNNFGYRCAMCDISTPDFLIGSHIVPVSKDKDNRMNPSNGLCLCVLHDRAFDNGYIAVNSDSSIIFSPALNKDKILTEILFSITRKRLRKPQFYVPATTFLSVHRFSIFRSE